MPINLISDVRSTANMLRMLALRKDFSRAKLSFNLDTKKVSWKAASLSGLVNYGGLVFHHQTDESLARWLCSELTTP